MIQYLKQYAGTHLFYLVIIGISLVAFHSWKQEHDARLLAEQQVQASDAAVKESQQQISTLTKQISAGDAKAAQQIAALQKAFTAVKTTKQAADEIPHVVTNLPTPVVVQPDESLNIPKVDVIPIVQDLADAKVATVKLAQCQADYATEQQIAAQKDSQLSAKDKEITALKKPKGFWRRIGSAMKQIGVGIGIGAVLGAKL